MYCKPGEQQIQSLLPAPFCSTLQHKFGGFCAFVNASYKSCTFAVRQPEKVRAQTTPASRARKDQERSEALKPTTTTKRTFPLQLPPTNPSRANRQPAQLRKARKAPEMADTVPTTPSSPIARTQRPVSEALLNDKVRQQHSTGSIAPRNLLVAGTIRSPYCWELELPIELLCCAIASCFTKSLCTIQSSDNLLTRIITLYLVGSLPLQHTRPFDPWCRIRRYLLGSAVPTPCVARRAWYWVWSWKGLGGV